MPSTTSNRHVLRVRCVTSTGSMSCWVKVLLAKSDDAFIRKIWKIRGRVLRIIGPSRFSAKATWVKKNMIASKTKFPAWSISATLTLWNCTTSTKTQRGSCLLLTSAKEVSSINLSKRRVNLMMERQPSVSSKCCLRFWTCIKQELCIEISSKKTFCSKILMTLVA